ncbi:MAG: AAA family ATPase [Magnetococcales bacterium]|nr:AAA family ATPase [Magnetococcales bacterium]
MMAATQTFDLDHVRQAANGNWPRIHAALGLAPQFLSKIHGPCPFCGGKDRFRYDDKEGRGTFICAQCGAGDGLALAARLLGHGKQDFGKTLAAVAGVLGIGGHKVEKRPHLSVVAAHVPEMPDYMREEPPPLSYAEYGIPDALPDEATWGYPQSDSRGRASPAPKQEKSGQDRPPPMGRPGVSIQEKTQNVLAACRPADPEHPYLVDKCIKPNGALQQGQSLVIPLQSATGELTGVEYIHTDGSKKFLTGTIKKKSFHVVGSTPGALSQPLKSSERVLIAEGFATAASLHEATGHPVVVAFDAGNLTPVAEVIRRLQPNACIILCGDADANGTGQRHACAAAQKTGSLVVFPEFYEEELAVDPGQKPPSDFNDLHRARWLIAVKEAVDQAKPPPMEEKQPDEEATGAVYRYMSSVTPEPIQWLWPGRIPKGKLTLQAGDPGLGKSQVALYQAATVSTGGTWPDGSQCQPGNVIIISVEDDPGDTISPRLAALGADMSRIVILEAVKDTGFAYRIETVTVLQNIETSKIVWEQGIVTMSADEALAAQTSNPDEKSALDEACEFLTDQLQLGPVEAGKLKTEARNAGIAERTLLRAKTMIGIKSRKEIVSGKWKWFKPTP